MMISTVKGVLWNSMLAIIPVLLGYAVYWIAHARLPRIAKIVFALVAMPVWFLFLPNTCYLLTEWRHYLALMDQSHLYTRAQMDSSLYVPLFALSIFFVFYSGFGVFTFALAIRPIERVAKKLNKPIWLWALPFFAIVSLGVYLGLVLRFNTWDTISHLRSIWSASLDAMARPKLSLFIIAFGLFLWLAYEAVDIWIDAAAERWQLLTGKRPHLGPKH